MTKRSKTDVLAQRLKDAARRAEISELLGPLPPKRSAVQPVRRAVVQPEDIVEHRAIEAFQLDGQIKRQYRVKLLGRKDGGAYTDTIIIHASSDADAKRHAAAAFLAAPLAMGVRVKGGCDDSDPSE